MHLRSASLVVTVGLLSAPGLLPVSAVIQQLTYTLPAQTQAEDFIVRIRDIENHA